MTDANDSVKAIGTMTWELRDENGEIKSQGVEENIVTQVGDQMYAERGAGITTTPVPTGMKLGSGTTAAAKTGAGAALATYIANSHQAFDGGYPSSALNGSARRITYRCTFAAGKGTGNIQELVIVNEALSDATSTAANTVHRIVSAIGNKASGDSLVVTWTYDLS